ncbi:two component transcriptional regulator, winged helix family [Denitrovibrio acetiphilus DSM 12809]|uniref:Two component transcriptional regulator, winged helix family n=1 Tax=Denitrovibrio acetiphilus (strain DSM 12809 / NBRC 114555 / N2460) TaxID=522772 RepID=D4H6X3_DENA2|nr:response regulator transcription factor [Denitrovibrio acetiphilus]ADD67839.1 two component transcriptional regulator, winged helix family [Denitrovibrio acetiphilus DSM 12809]
MKILIVDDEVQLVDELKSILEKSKYSVDTAVSGDSGLDKIFDNEYSLIILDVMLPVMDGFCILEAVREASITTPVLMLTAKSDVSDRIKGLDKGSDDYLVKPFAVSELLARVRALLRRDNLDKNPFLKVADIVLNTVSCDVVKDGHPLKLTRKEYMVFEYLLYNKNRVVTKAALAGHVWGDEFDEFNASNFIDVHIKNLRKKIGDENHLIIRTKRGIGYIINDQNEN